MAEQEPALPSKQDFGTAGFLDPDAECARDHFGGLTVDEAYRRFCSNPLFYQEDFMFMGDRAFAFYFGVLDRYLRETIKHRTEDRYDELRSIAKLISFHRFPDSTLAPDWLSRVADLCRHVIESLPTLEPIASQETGWNAYQLSRAWRETLEALPERFH